MTRALVVDDNPDNLYLLRVLLGGNGWHVTEARHGAEALSKAHESVPDLVISDLLMPVMDGYTLLRHWKADVQLDKVPFVVYTATYTDARAEQLARDLGADAFILKPADPATFLVQLQEILSRTQQGSLVASQPHASEPKVLAHYSETLVRKLEDKHAEVEHLNEDIAAQGDHLRTATAFTQATIDALPAHLCVLDEDGTIIATNAAWRRFGDANSTVPPRINVGVNYLEVCDRAARQDPGAKEFAAGVRAVLDGTRESFELEYPCHATTQRRWFIGRVTRFGDRQLPRLVVSHENITERVLAEIALRNSEERFRKLAENAQDVLFRYELEPQRRFAYVSPAATTVTGYTPEEHYANPNLSFEMVHPEDLPRLERRSESDEEFSAPMTTRWVRKDGEVIWTEQRNVPVRDRDGRLIAVEGIVRDVTARMRTAQALERSEERYRLLFDANPLPMWVYDLETLRFLAVNDAAVEHYGYSREEFLARTIVDIRPEADVPRLMEDIASLSPRDNRSAVWRHRRRDGSLIDVQVTADSLDFDGRPARLVLALDITTQLRLEEDLRQSQKLEAVGRLAGGIAHDFNNLLAVMLLQTELLQGSADDPQAIHLGLEEIRGAAERAANLTRQLLLFSRRQVLQPRNLDLNEAARGVATMLHRLLGEDINLQLELHPDPLITYADPGMVDQVLLNLALNARDAMPKGGNLVLASSPCEVDDELAKQHQGTTTGPFAKLTVRDTGSGIAPEDLPHIFEPFFTTKTAGQGTGLGLSTAFGIVQQHHGWIAVTSAVGVGTSFDVLLPLVISTPAVAPKPAPHTESAKGKETILVVEDEPLLLRVTRRVLERSGYRVLEATNGPEALAVWEARNAPVALLLTDLVLPGGMNGQDVAARLRERDPDLRVVLTSGYSADLAGRELELEPGHAFLQKPVQPQVLLETVRHCLDR